MKTTHKIAAWLAGAALLLAVGAMVAVWTFSQIEQAAAVRKNSYAVIAGALGFMSALKDAETGQRGYMLSADDAFLAPYTVESGKLVGRLQALRQMSSIAAAQKHVDALLPMTATLLGEMAQSIALRRANDMNGALALVRRGQGKSLMDSIRVEMQGFIALEDGLLEQREAEFAANLRRMFILIMCASLSGLLFAVAFAGLLYRQTQQRFRDLVHLETRNLLGIQEAMNTQLQQANTTLRDSEENLAVTLNSIGDAVIATDAKARVTRLNPVAEQLTGWSQEQAIGIPIDQVFHIINQETRLPSAVPVIETLARGTVQGLANHTVLIARAGGERAIADSCAPICDRAGEVIGAVLVFRDVSEDYAAQQALRDSAALIQTILNTVVDGIVTLHAGDGVVESVNPAAERMFGYAAAELKGRNFSLLIPELDREQSKGSLDYYSASNEQRASGLEREVVGRRRDGSSFPLEIAVSQMWLGGERYFTGMLRDITARKQAEAALVEAGALQSAIFNSASFSSIATDARGVIQIFNVGAEHMLGYAAADVMDRITPADISDAQEVIARAQALSVEFGMPIAPGFEALAFKASRGIGDIYELTYIRKDGSRFPALVSVTALRDARDAIIGYLLIGTDNTARLRVEAERALLDQALQDKNVELERARVVAERANLTKSDFLSSMSHELRTPLGAILGFAQLLESGTPAPTAGQQRSIDQILKAGWYLLELINEILDLALIESGKLSISLEAVAVAEVMRECAAMIEPLAQKRGISVRFASFAAPVVVHADRTRVKQVLINLLSNAIKYNTAEGSVDVDFAVSPPASPHAIRISVRDSGAGLAAEQLTQLFQPFNRLGQEASSEQGTGIGLVVSKRLVELMDGAIGVESQVGQGCVFWIELPLASADRAVAGPELPAAMAPVAAPGVEPLYTLLYVEDNPANLMLVRDLVARRPDIRLLSAVDGDQGIVLARSARPDVILMDINLPGISGLRVLEMLTEDPDTARIPVLALSANAIPRDIEKGLAAGFFRYLTKPLKVKEFMGTLDLALKFARSAAPSKNKEEEA